MAKAMTVTLPTPTPDPEAPALEPSAGDKLRGQNVSNMPPAGGCRGGDRTLALCYSSETIFKNCGTDGVWRHL